MNAPVPRLTPDYGTKCPELVDTLTKKQTDFSLKIEMGGEAILGLSRLDYPLAKTGVTGSAVFATCLYQVLAFG